MPASKQNLPSRRPNFLRSETDQAANNFGGNPDVIHSFGPWIYSLTAPVLIRHPEGHLTSFTGNVFSEKYKKITIYNICLIREFRHWHCSALPLRCAIPSVRWLTPLTSLNMKDGLLLYGQGWVRSGLKLPGMKAKRWRWSKRSPMRSKTKMRISIVSIQRV